MDGEVLNSMKMLDLEPDEWRMQSQTLTVARKDHACVLTSLDDEEGILVTGGVDGNNKALASVDIDRIILETPQTEYFFKLQTRDSSRPEKAQDWSHHVNVLTFYTNLIMLCTWYRPIN